MTSLFYRDGEMVNLLIDDGNAVLVEDGAAILVEHASAVRLKVEHPQDMDSQHSEHKHRHQDQDSQQSSQALCQKRDYVFQHDLDCRFQNCLKHQNCLYLLKTLS